MNHSRRELLITATAAALPLQAQNSGGIPTRPLGKTGVRVNAVGPGPIRTPLTEPLFAAHDWLEPKWVESVPLGRIGEPEDLAGIFVYLASPASRWVTGRSFYIDGGWLL